MTGPRIATLLADGSGTVRSDTGGTIPPQLGRIAAGSSRVTLDTGRICHVGVRPVPDPGRPRLVC